MKRLLAVMFAALIGLAHAQSGTSPNLVYSTVNPYPGTTDNPGSWTGFVNSTTTGGGYSGGSQPAYNPNTGTFYFGYTQAQIAYTYAFSQALQNSGMTITGYNYSYEYLNQDMSSGNLSAKLNFASTSGTSLYSKTWTLGPTTNWTTVSGTDTFSNGLLASNIANFSLSFSGKDSRYWAGYYGPQLKVPSVSLNYTFDVCTTDPLSSPSCPGYATAYLTQQCTANPLYSSQCAGYAVAYFTQQCNINPMYSPDCPGYASAYLTYQCTQNPLYSTTCPGYETAYFNQQCSENPLYNSRCPGYTQAYTTQQCSINPLYSTSCSGYATAYHDQQCSINPLFARDCPGYSAAYLTQQCSADPLYSTQCSGYAIAYKTQQCTLNPLYATDCPGYATAYKTQQCNLNGLYDKTCPNYAEAYAKKMLLEQQGLASTVATAGVVAKTAEVANANTTTTSTSDGSSSVAVAVVADPVVNQAVTSTATSTSPAAAATATVSLAPAPAPATTTATQQPPPPAPPAEKPAQPTARQQMMEQRREAAKKDAVAKGKDLANEMGKAADMESQKQVQNVVIQAMGFTPGFDAYGKVLVPDAVGYKPFTVYNNQKTVDNRRVGMGLYGPSDRLHNDLVNSQYKD